MRPSSAAAALLGIIALFVTGCDTSAPTLAFSKAGGPISAKGALVITVKDPDSGLKEFTVSAQQENKTIPVLSKKYPKGTREAVEKPDLAGAGLKQGPFRLVVNATDHSIFPFGAGNTVAKVHDFDFDNKPPAVAVLSVAHNVARGGVGLVVYTVSKEVSKTGVVFDDRFFPGYRQNGGFYAALFPFPYDIEEGKYQPKVLAVDQAGNQRVMGMYYHLHPKVFSADRINLTDTYLSKVAAEFQDKYPQAKSPLEVFLKVNREGRVADAKILAECAQKTSPAPLWQGTFMRLPNAAQRGGYAQRRTYVYQGQEVDRQTHLGVDLASLAHAPVPSANDGKVVYADFLGIYGQCVIIDHGMGLQTLYGHLSKIAVKAGQAVKKGEIIGNTGDTGLAGGDHLHFGIVVSGEQVSPVEWWDPSWIKNNVTSKLEAAQSMAGQK